MIDTIVARLLALPGELAEAELLLIQCEADKREAATRLQDAEDQLLLAGLDGKNAETRAAQVRAATLTEQLLMARAEEALAYRRAVLTKLRSEHSSLRAITRLLSVAAATD